MFESFVVTKSKKEYLFLSKIKIKELSSLKLEAKIYLTEEQIDHLTEITEFSIASCYNLWLKSFAKKDKNRFWSILN